MPIHKNVDWQGFSYLRKIKENYFSRSKEVFLFDLFDKFTIKVIFKIVKGQFNKSLFLPVLQSLYPSFFSFLREENPTPEPSLTALIIDLGSRLIEAGEVE